MYPGTEFLLKPAFLRGISGSLHLVLLLGLFVSWVWKKLRVEVSDSEGYKERFKKKSVLRHKLILFCCLAVSVFNLVEFVRLLFLVWK